MDVVTMAETAIQKSCKEDHNKLGHTMGRIQHISIISRIEFFYKDCFPGTQTSSPTLIGFQGLNICIKYLDNHPYKPTFFFSGSYDGSSVGIYYNFIPN